MRYIRRIGAIVAVLLFAGLLTGCGDDGGSPKNRRPVISSLTADPDTVDPSGSSTISCAAGDANGDSLVYIWDAADGAIEGSGPSIAWRSPLEAGSYAIWVTVSDGRGESVSDTVLVEVREGSLLVRTANGLVAADLYGNSSLFNTNTGSVEVLDTRIFVGGTVIAELDREGSVVGTITAPPEVPGIYNFAILPDAGVAFLDNATDTISFVDSQGSFITNIEIPGHDFDHSQNTEGMLMGNTLIVSENGARQLVEVDLSTYAAGIYRDLSQAGGWIGDIDYSDGVFYICQCTRVLTFTEGSDPVELFALDGGCITGIAVVGNYAYTVVNSPGTVNKTDINTGNTEVLLDGLTYPEDIEFIPVDLLN